MVALPLQNFTLEDALVDLTGTGIGALGPNINFMFAVDLSAMATAGDGSVGNPYTGFETAFNALVANAWVHVPAGDDGAHGFYTRTARMECKLGQTIFGDGKESSIIQSSDVGTSFRIDVVPGNPFAVLQHGHVTFRDLQIKNTNVANTGCGILAVSVTYCVFERVKVLGHKVGLAVINCHSMTIGGPSYFASQITAGAWLVNDGSYKPANGLDLDYSGYIGGGTNDITIDRWVIFNESATCYGVIDDGGDGRQFVCGFNGCLSALVMAGASEVNIQMHSEGASSHIAVLTFTRFYGAAGGGCGNVKFDSAYFAPTAAFGCIRTDSVVSLVLVNNNFNTSNPAISNGAGANTVVNLRSTVASSTLFGVSFPTRYVDIGSDNRVTIGGLPLVIANSAGATRIGTTTLVAGSSTIANTSVTANTVVLPIRQVVGGAAGALGYTINPGVGFTITSASGTDTSTVDWILIEKG